MERASENRKQLASLFVATLIAAVAFNLVWALFMFKFFSRQFIQRIRALHQNLDPSANSGTVADQGSDEISELDRSVHHMWSELTRKAEQEQSLFDNSSDIICVLNENFEIERINPAVKAVWGFEAKDLTGKRIGNNIAPDQWAQVEQSLTASKIDNPAGSFEFDMQRQNGEKFRALWSTYWSTQNRCWFCVIHDISEQFHFEKLREAFLTLIARDLETPLQKIQGLFERLRSLESTMPTPCHAKIRDCVRTLSRLTAMVGELMVVERLADPGNDLVLVKSSIREVLEAAVGDVQGLATRKEITVTVESIDGEFEFDRAKIVRLIVNLLANSIKFSPAGSTVTVRGTEDSQGLTVSVIDQGPGIAPEALNALFRPFQQVSAEDGARGKGTGLGLVICKKLAELHGGTIGANSEPGKGSEFWFSLPRNIETAKSEQRKQTEQPAPKSPPTSPVAPTKVPYLVALTEGLGLSKIRAIMLVLPVVFQLVMVASISGLLYQGQGLLSREIIERELTVSAVRVCTGYCDMRIAVLSRERGHVPSALRNLVVELQHYRTRFVDNAKKCGLPPSEYEKAERLTARTEPMAANMIEDVIAARMTPSETSSHRLVNATDSMLVVSSKVNETMLPIIDHCQQLQRKNRADFYALTANCLAGLTTGLIANLLLAIGLGALFSSSVSRRLKIMAGNARHVAEGEEIAPVVSGTDEIARMDRSFHEIVQRVTDARQRERAYLDNSREIIGTLDQELKFSSLNSVAAEYLGKSPKELIGTALADTVIPSKQNALESLTREERVVRIELVHLPNNLDLDWSIRWSGKEKQYFVIGRDVTSRKALERMKQEFIAVVSHDLRSPLSTVLGNAELMKHGVFGPLTPETTTVLEQIVGTVDQVLELINDLLDLEKVNAGQMKLISSNVKLSELVTKAVAIARPIMERYSLQLVSNTSELEVNADSDRLAQAIASLLQEIATLGQQSGGTIELRGFQTRETAELEFAATSLHLTDEQLRALQSRLDNAELDAAPDSHGGRLRLPLAKSIVECHHGSLVASIGSAGELLLQVRLPLAPLTAAAQ